MREKWHLTHKEPKYHFPKGHIPWDKGIHRVDISGEKNPTWRGGITPLHEKQRKSIEYKAWRKAIFERDNYTCVWCGVKNGEGKAIYLEADHIRPFALYSDLRFSIDNGRTLCKECHKKTSTYNLQLYGQIELERWGVII